MFSVQHSLFSSNRTVLDLNVICLSFLKLPPSDSLRKTLIYQRSLTPLKDKHAAAPVLIFAKICLWVFCASLWFTELTPSFSVAWFQERVHSCCLPVHFLDQLRSVIMQHGATISQRGRWRGLTSAINSLSFKAALKCVLHLASSVLHFLLSRHSLVRYFSTFQPPLQANLCLNSFFSSAFVFFSAATAWKTTQWPPQTVIYVQSCPSPLSFHKQEISWAPLSEATRRLLLSNEREASLCFSWKLRKRISIPQFDSGCLFCLDLVCLTINL